MSGRTSGAEADVHGFDAQGYRAVPLCCGSAAALVCAESALQALRCKRNCLVTQICLSLLCTCRETLEARLGSYRAHYLDGM